MINLPDLLGYLQANYPDELAAGDDGAIFAAMTATAPETVTGAISPGKFATWAATGPRSAIESHAANLASPLNASALSLRDFLAGSMPEFDLSLPGLQGLVAAWVGAGAITQEQSDNLYALAQRSQTIAERDGFAGLRFDDIVAARAMQ